MTMRESKSNTVVVVQSSIVRMECQRLLSNCEANETRIRDSHKEVLSEYRRRSDNSRALYGGYSIVPFPNISWVWDSAIRLMNLSLVGEVMHLSEEDSMTLLKLRSQTAEKIIAENKESAKFQKEMADLLEEKIKSRNELAAESACEDIDFSEDVSKKPSDPVAVEDKPAADAASGRLGLLFVAGAIVVIFGLCALFA